jgi:hypothetical protein
MAQGEVRMDNFWADQNLMHRQFNMRPIGFDSMNQQVWGRGPLPAARTAAPAAAPMPAQSFSSAPPAPAPTDWSSVLGAAPWQGGGRLVGMPAGTFSGAPAPGAMPAAAPAAPAPAPMGSAIGMSPNAPMILPAMKAGGFF